MKSTKKFLSYLLALTLLLSSFCVSASAVVSDNSRIDASARITELRRTYFVPGTEYSEQSLMNWSLAYEDVERILNDSDDTYTDSDLYAALDGLEKAAKALVPKPERVTVLNAGSCNNGDEKWYAWTWNGTQNGRWVAAEIGTDGNFYFEELDENVLFARVDKAKSPDWDNGSVFNQTEDLKTKTDGSVFVITAWKSETSDKMQGDWREPRTYATEPTTAAPDLIHTQAFCSALNALLDELDYHFYKDGEDDCIVVSPENIDELKNRYFKIFTADESIVVFGLIDMWCTVGEEEIAGYLFKNPSFFGTEKTKTGIGVYKDGKAYEIKNAIDSGIMTADALAAVVPYTEKLEATEPITTNPVTDPTTDSESTVNKKIAEIRSEIEAFNTNHWFEDEEWFYSQYTEASYNAYMDACKAANKVYNDPDATYEELKAALDSMQNGYDSLVYVVSDDELREKLKARCAQIINSMPVGGTPYTKESAERFWTAMRNAEKTANDSESTRREIIYARNMLEDAYKKLEHSTANRDKIWDAIELLLFYLDDESGNKNYYVKDREALKELYNDAMPIAYYEPEQEVIDAMTERIYKGIEDNVVINETTESPVTEPPTTAPATTESPATEPPTTRPIGSEGDMLFEAVKKQYPSLKLKPEDLHIQLNAQLSEDKYLVKYTVNGLFYPQAIDSIEIGGYIYTDSYPKAEILDSTTLYQLEDAYEKKIITDSDLKAISKLLPDFKRFDPTEPKVTAPPIEYTTEAPTRYCDFSNSYTKIKGIKNAVYTGKPITLDISVVVPVDMYTRTETLSPENYTVTYKNNKNVGTATVIISPKNGAGGIYKTLTAKFKIKKAANPINVKSTVRSVKYKSLKRKAQTAAPLSVSRAQGELSFSKLSGDKRIKLNAKTGKLTFKKGMNKGSYTLRLKLTANGTANYKSFSKVYKVTVKVK